MSLDKAILHGKEKRKRYRGVKSYDSSCRNHGSCAYCRNGRLHATKIREARAYDALLEWETNKNTQ